MGRLDANVCVRPAAPERHNDGNVRPRRPRYAHRDRQKHGKTIEVIGDGRIFFQAHNQHRWSTAVNCEAITYAMEDATRKSS